MSTLEGFASYLARTQDELLEQDTRQLARVRARLLAPTPRRVPLGRGLVAVTGLATTALIATVGWAAWQWSSAPVAFSLADGRAGEVGHPLASGETEIALAFSDGSTVTLAPGTRAQVADATPDGARVALDAGRLEVFVKPGQGRSWRIDAGDFVVKVTGTRFAVTWAPEDARFELAMEKGRVFVSGPHLGGGQSVSAGERLEVQVGDGVVMVGEARASTRDSRGARPRAESRGSAPPEAAGADLAEPSEGAVSWRELAADGRYQEAMAAVDLRGFAELVAASDAGGLMALGDAARLAGDWRRARVAYLELRSRFGGEEEAVRASFFLGRIDFDRRGAWHEAASWFSRYLDEAPNGVFAEQALGRLIESWSGAGEAARAQATAQRYLARYPDGPHADYARKTFAP